MAVKGNATALHFLFSPPFHPGAWDRIVANAELFVVRNAGRQFLGFADDQRKRLAGQKGSGKKGHRPELEQEFGYDTKAAMHAIRLLGECREVVETGRITLPRPEREFLVRIRAGEFSLQQILEIAERMKQACVEVERNSTLADDADRERISQLPAQVTREHWDQRHPLSL